MSTASIGAHSRPATPRRVAARTALANARKQTTQAVEATRTRLWSLRRAALTVGGLTCIDVAAFQVNPGTGLLATGISAFVLDFLSDD